MKPRIAFFTKTKQLRTQFNTFLMNITTASFIFNEATSIYLKKQTCPSFCRLKDKIQTLERENDNLRREIEAELYRQMILPGMRSDILDLMEACDRVINQYERVVLLWSIECMKVPSILFDNIIELVQTTASCISALTTGVQAFFDGQINVEQEVQSCYFQEHSVDLLAFDVKEKIFQKKFSLARQLQLKEFVTSLEKISDLAEDAADKLKIISVKHAL